ncbi:MAG: right-handed parallel beta-helix repeat-containing protein [Planctomycetota bacterium]|jgi:hypothetical protein
MRKSIFAVFALITFCGTLNAATLEYYVSPQGSDSNPGTIDRPFAKIQQARDAIRLLKPSEKAFGVNVYLRGGEYVLDETLVFDLCDSSPQGTQFRYMAYKDEQPVITSAVAVTGWQKLSNALANLPTTAQDKVWVTDVANGNDFKVLYNNGVMLPRARSKGFSPVRSDQGKGDIKRLTMPEDFDLRKWDNYNDVEVLIRPTYAWTMNILPIADVDVASRQVTTTVGGTYPLEPQPQWSMEAHGISDTCWFENALEFLDSPGEWVFDSKTDKLYLWPKDSQRPQNITMPQCVELIRIEGQPQQDMPVDKVVSGIVFKGIKFTGNDRYTWTDAEPSFQHDWSAVDQASAMLRLRCASDCVIEDCQFVQGGTAGVRIYLQASGNRIEGNRFSYLGEHGIAICGYGPGTKDVNRANKVLNNRIDHIGQLYWYAFGIYIAQSGENYIANNLIHNIPFVGITLSGCRDFNYQRPRNGEGYRTVRWQDFSDRNKKMLQDAYGGGKEMTEFFLSYLHARDNIIEGNEIFAAVETMGDGNAIYLSGAGTGNLIKRNYIHHILSSGIQTALRPDDLQEQTMFEENIVYKCVYGAVEHKHNNDYINNIFACIYPTNIHGRTWNEWAYVIFGRGPNTGSRLQRNIFYDDSTDPRFYYNRQTSPMDDSIVDNNLYYCKDNYQIAKKQLKELQDAGHDAHSISADPKFVDIDNGNFLFESGSPAFDIGIKPIDTTAIGLQSPWKERLVGEKLIKTRITPSTHYIVKEKPFKITIKCDEPGAVIRYTTDSSEPTENSSVYTAAIKFDKPVFIRAKAFKQGAVDLYGAAEFYAVKGAH